MASQMDYEVGYSESPASVNFCSERGHRLLVDLILGTGEVWKIRHMINNRTDLRLAEFFPEFLHLLDVKVDELPTLRVSRENLKCVATVILGTVASLIKIICDRT